MAIHKVKDSVVGLVPYVAIVLDGDWTETLKEGDEIQTLLVKYRIESFGYDAKLKVTTVVVKEIVL